MIVFKTLTVRNFMSAGDNGLTYKLDEVPTTLVTGKNGSGKSALLVDGLCFVLFGKSYRGINKPALINSINQRDSLVEVEFVKGSEEWKIIRGQKPNRLEVYRNGIALNEEAALSDTQTYIERNVLGFDFSAFVKICVVSTTNYKPFTELSTGERRAFVETILCLTEFSDMAKVHRGKQSLLRDELLKVDSQLSSKRSEFESCKALLKSASEHDEEKKNRLISEAKALAAHALEIKSEVKRLNDEIASIGEQSIKDQIASINNDRNIAMVEYSSLQHRIDSLKASIDSVDSMQECPSCHQVVTDDHKESVRSTNLPIIEQLAAEMNTVCKIKEEKKRELLKLGESMEALRGLQTEVSKLNMQYNSIIERSKDKIKLANEDKSHSIDIQAQLDKITGELAALAQSKRDLESKSEIYKVVADLLKDTGIKSSIIDKFIPILVTYVNKYLTMLGFNVRFDMDTEFRETIITRFANEHTFANLSMGERLRVSLAIILAWNTIAKMRGQVDTNLIILDEILDSSIDGDGTEDLFTLIEGVFANKNIWLISHKDSFHEKVHKHIHVEKVKGFTKLVEMD